MFSCVVYYGLRMDQQYTSAYILENPSEDEMDDDDHNVTLAYPENTNETENIVCTEGMYCVIRCILTGRYVMKFYFVLLCLPAWFQYKDITHTIITYSNPVIGVQWST